MNQFLDYGGTCMDVLLALVTIVVGVVVVRPARPTAGWLLLASGVVSILTDCCNRVTDQLMTGGTEVTVANLVGRLEGLVSLVLWLGLTIAAAATLAPEKQTGP